MTIRKSKVSVVEEVCESQISCHKKKDKSSTIKSSYNSIRKRKVSEAILPILSELDGFSLKISSETSANRSIGSLNETFEKNINFNFQNSFHLESSIESHNKKVSIAATPLIGFSRFNKYIGKENVNKINEDIVESPRKQHTDSIPINELSKIQSNNISEVQLGIIFEGHEVVEDIDDVRFSSDDDNASKDESFKIVANEERNEEIKDSKNISQSKKARAYNLRIKRQAKQIVKENTIKQKDQSFHYPVDIDASESCDSNNKAIKINNHSGIIVNQKSEIVNEKQVSSSKLCDVSKAYLHSQDSSMISSPIEQNKIKSTSDLPGRESTILSDSVSKKFNNNNRSTTIDLKAINVECKPKFFKTSFQERRLQEIERFIHVNKDKSTNKTGNVKVKNSKSSKKKEIKPKKISKKRVSKKKSKNLYTPLVLSGDSNKEQTDKITIEDSDNEKFNLPIEKTRGLIQNEEEDLFSFTPQFVQKGKLKTTKQKVKRSRKPNWSEAYDIHSDMSSPLALCKSFLTYKSNKSLPLKKGIQQNKFLNEIIEKFESNVDLLKNIHQSMNFQINQFKNILSGSDII